MGLLPHGYLGGTKSHRGSIIGDKTGKFKIVVHEMTILVRATVFERSLFFVSIRVKYSLRVPLCAEKMKPHISFPIGKFERIQRGVFHEN